ncbi:MAG: Type 1 glutamine amidotransferase-like domain-containing protein [Candidatus Paceibacterota bacterium]|jgi:dipeptidase E
MKILLTSSGITNKSIAEALFDLVGKKPEETSLVFIPTASNVEKGNKDWLIDDLVNLKNQNFKQIEIADISAVPEEIWRPKLEEADVLFFEGGNTFHLMEWINKSGLKELLPKLLETRVYVGVSAGSMVTNPDLSLKLSRVVYGEDLERTEDMAGLNYVDFHFLPHLNSEFFPDLRKDKIERVIAGVKKKVYAMDDNGALKVMDGKVEIVSEGQYLEFN